MSAICGTDLHFVRGTMSWMSPGRVLGHISRLEAACRLGAVDGPAAADSDELSDEFAAEVAENVPQTNQEGDLRKRGDAPTQAARWHVDAIAKADTIGMIGVYPLTAKHLPSGRAMNKNLILKRAMRSAAATSPGC